MVEGVAFREVEPVEIIRSEKQNKKNYCLVHFFGLPLNHWETPITPNTINNVRGLLAHWDGLDSGRRLRRAARQYHKAVGTDSAITAFQHTYMGMEALEKPLAVAINIEPGVEEIQGKCEKCGVEYTRRRTVLAGVRAFIQGDFHPEMGSFERRKEWKEINKLRQNLFHSLEDGGKIEQDAHKIVPAAMHYLHDAVCCLSHAHELETSKFMLVRGMRQIVLVGQFSSDGLVPLEHWRPLLDVEEGYWVAHTQHGAVPEFRIVNHGLKDLNSAFFWLTVPLNCATEKNLVPANWEAKETA